MLRFFDYIFYRQYKYNRQRGISEYWASWSAICWTSIIVMLTIAGFASLIELITGNRIIEAFLELPKLEQYGLILLFVIAVEIRWGSTSAYRNIVTKYEAQKVTKRHLMVRSIGVWVYIFIWTLIIALYLIGLVHHASISTHAGS
jgi:Na+-driven multidrug efflux pump